MEMNMFLWTVFLAQVREGKEQRQRRDSRRAARETDRPVTVMWLMVDRKLTSTKSRQLV